jgi:putative transposase
LVSRDYNIIGLKHYLHSPLVKSLIERVMQYFKDRTENFDDYYPCRKNDDCNIDHVFNWIELFVLMYNDIIVQKNRISVIEGGIILLN